MTKKEFKKALKNKIEEVTLYKVLIIDTPTYEGLGESFLLTLGLEDKLSGDNFDYTYCEYFVNDKWEVCSFEGKSSISDIKHINEALELIKEEIED